MIVFQRHSMCYQLNRYQKEGFQIQTLFSVVTVFYLWGDRRTETQYNFMTALPQRSVVALTLRPWPITAVGSEPLSWIRKCVTDGNEISMSSPFPLLSLSSRCHYFVSLLPLECCLRHNPWVSLSASYCVTSLRPTLHLKHTSHILEWWHCLCLPSLIM